jgi:mannonate dehydratase
MIQTMRWFGPSDPVPLSFLQQAGVQGIVTALHHLPNGAVWSSEEIQTRKSVIEAASRPGSPLEWTVVESVPVHEDIKKGTGNFRQYLRNYQETLKNLGKAGVKTVCYNFMPVLDWSRTDLEFAMPDGSKALYFQYPAFAAFDIFILRRPGAKDSYTPDVLEEAQRLFSGWSDAQKTQIAATILRGLPGAEEHFSLASFQEVLDAYSGVNEEKLRQNLGVFLEEVVPVADECGIRLAIHPDDPPFSLLGLPRILSIADDVRKLLGMASLPANGLCFCAGSFGARPDNHLNEMASEFAGRIHFLHLRAVKRDQAQHRSFVEADHLEGDADMVELIRIVHKEEKRRALAGRWDDSIPMRPDHGHQMLDDLEKSTNPGYSAIGRLRGLAELRGIEKAISQLDG